MTKNKNNTEPTIYLIKKMWKFSEWNRRNVIVYILMSCLANIFMLLEPIVFAFFINEIQQNWVVRSNIWYLLFILSLMIFLGLAFWFFHWISRVIERKNAFLVRLNYKKYLFEKTLNFDLDWHNNKQSGDSIDKIEKATTSLYEFSGRMFMIIKIMISAIWTIVALLYFGFYISIWVLIGVIIGIYILSLFDKRLVPQYKSINISENKITAKIYDSLSNITSVIILNIKRIVLGDIEKSFYLPESVFNKNIVLNELKWFSWSIFLRIITIVPISFYVLQSYHNNTIIQAWTISALYLYLSNLSGVFFWFSELYSKIIIQKTSVENATAIEYWDTNKVIRRKTIQAKNIELKELKFSYQDSDMILDNVNLHIKSWEKIAIIWHSGSWKTTFLKILHSLYHFSDWKIVINGNKSFSDLSTIDLQTTLVPQEPELFVASIRENITFWLDYSDKKIREFTDMSCFSEVVDRLPSGLDSKINEKWVNLSGWQKQRLALARALLFAEKKNIILLDESTSSVDAGNETKIYKNILKSYTDKTIISSIHKLNLLKYFDRVILFEDWKIICDGNFKYLLKNNKKFSQMWKEFKEDK